jgi:hypothetical protein
MYPADAAARVWAIHGKDSIEMTNVNGEFIVRSINPGQWRISVVAAGPYRNAHFDLRDIKPGTDLDLGEIRLRK